MGSIVHVEKWKRLKDECQHGRWSEMKACERVMAKSGMAIISEDFFFREIPGGQKETKL